MGKWWISQKVLKFLDDIKVCVNNECMTRGKGSQVSDTRRLGLCFFYYFCRHPMFKSQAKRFPTLQFKPVCTNEPAREIMVFIT